MNPKENERVLLAQCFEILPGGPVIVKPDLVAPGVKVLSCVPPTGRGREPVDWALKDGTSMASAQVAGAVALLRAACPQASAEDVVKAVRESACHPGGSPDNRWGYGEICLEGAYELLSNVG